MISPTSTKSFIRSVGEAAALRESKVMPKQSNAILSTERPNVLPLKGEIDLHVSPRVAVSLAQLTQKKTDHIIVDLSRVTYIDSSGLAVLIEGMQNAEEYGGKFSLTGLKKNVYTIFEIARLDQVFRIFPNVDAALAAA